MFRVVSGDGDAVVDSVERFGEDSCEEADGDKDGVECVFEGGDGFVGYDEGGEVEGAEEELRPCGDGVFLEGGESG
jgi:hypothetical protein